MMITRISRGLGLFNRRNGDVSQAQLDAAVKMAVADATTASTLASHIAECNQHKAKIDAAIAEQNASRERMHVENSIRFDRLNKMIWMAAGAVSLVGFLLSTQLGATVLPKIFH